MVFLYLLLGTRYLMPVSFLGPPAAVQGSYYFE